MTSYYMYSKYYLKYLLQYAGRSIIQLFDSKSKNNIMIGEGGAGKVYINKEIPGYVIKQSDKQDTCRTWVNEKELIDNVNESLAELTFENIQIIKVHEYFSKGNICYILLDRVYHPDAKEESDANKMYQILLGEEDCADDAGNRGIFIGLKQIQPYISYPDMIESCYNLGRAISAIHYIAKNDLWDFELLFGKSSIESTEYKFYIIDFDLSEKITDYTDLEQVKRIIWSLTAINYIPNPALPDGLLILYEQFKKGYLEIAHTVSMDECANYVIEAFEEYYDDD